MVTSVKRYLSQSEIDYIRETLKACDTEFDELMRSKDWFVTSVTDDIEVALDILEDKDVKTDSSNTGPSD